MDPNLRVHLLQPTATHFITSEEGGKIRKKKKNKPTTHVRVYQRKSQVMGTGRDSSQSLSFMMFNPHPMSAEPRMGNDRRWPELPVGCWSSKVHLSTLACTAQRIIKIAK